jgi:hypothetical protein
LNSSGAITQGGNQVLHAANYNSYAPSLTGTNASGSWGISITGNAATATTATRSTIEDTRTAQRSPNDYDDYRASYEFTNKITGLTDWHSAFTMQGWHDGYSAWQIIGPASTSAHENFYLRSGNLTSWNAVRIILHAGNYNSYALPLTGGNITGNGFIDFGANSSWSATLRVGGNGHTGSTRASVVTTNGNLHLDAAADRGIYLNWYNGTGSTGVYFGNGDGGQVGSVNRSGNASFANVTATSFTGSLTGSASQLNGLSSTQLFNNMGQNHGTYTDANSFTNFGSQFLQGTANGPGAGANQWYMLGLGLGNEYAYSRYACQFAIPRTPLGGNPYLSVRFREDTTWGSWAKVWSGYADNLINFTSAIQNSPMDANSPPTLNAVGYVTNNIPSLYGNGGSVGAQSDGGLYVAGHSTSWYHQIFGDFRTGGIAVRGKRDNTWQSWRNVPCISIQDNAPSIYNPGDLWWESDTGRLKILYYDGNSSQWVDTVPVINTSLFFSKAGGAITGPVSINGALQVTGNITATAEITAYYSDRRLKTDVLIIENALLKVKKLNGVTYRPNELATSYGLGNNSDMVGLFADEVEQVLPQAVKPAPFDIDENGNSKSGENFKTIQYEKIIPLLIEAIKEQQSIIETQRVKIDKLMKHLGLED